MNLAFAGLVLIAVAWLVQLAFSWKGNREIHPIFIVCYMIGVLGLIIADYLEKSTLSYFELFTVIAAGLLLLRIITVRK